MKHSQFLAFSTPNFIGSISVVEATVTIRSLFRKSFLFLAFMLLPMTGWGATLTAHQPGVYEKAVKDGGYGIDLTKISGTSYEVYYFSANSKYGNTCTGVTAAQYRIMAADSNSEHLLIASAAADDYKSEKNCDWISMNHPTTGFAKSDYEYGSTTFSEFFAIKPNGGNSQYTKTCYIKPKAGDVITLKVKGYVEFAWLGKDNGSSKYVTVSVDGGTATTWKSTTLSRRSVALTTGEHTIVIANVGSSANNIYGFSLKLPAATKHSITYSAGDGSGTVPTHADVAENDTFHVASAAGLTAPAGQEFKCWNDGTNDYNPGATYTMGKSNVTLTAQWTAKTDKYTVKYMDGTTEMGTETVEVGKNPTASEITTTKAHYQFESWQKNGEDIALSSVSGTKDQTITLTARYSAQYASSFNFGATTDLTKDNIKSKLEAKNYTCSIGTGGSYDSGGTTGYLGYKFKNNGDWVEFLLKQGDIATVTYGYTESGWNVNGASAGVATGQKAYVDKVYYATDGDKIYKLENLSANGKTSVLTKIIIETPAPKYTVTYSLNEGTGTIPTQADQEEGAKFNLALKGDIAKEGFDFVGWDDGIDTLAAGSEYTMPGEAVSFSAAWAVHVTNYTVTFKDGETTMGTEQVRENEYATAAGISTAKAGFIFQNWCSDKDLTTAVTLSSAAIVKDTTFYAKYEKAYALSVDFASIADGSAGTPAEVLAANYYTHAGTNTSWDNNTSSNNGAYQGLKMKASGTTIDFDVPANKLVALRVGVLDASKSDMYKDGTKVAENMTGGSITSGNANFKMYYFCKEGSDAHYRFQTTANNAQVIKAITITDPYKVTLDATTAGGEAVDPLYFKGTALDLPTAVKTDWTFAGWFDNAELTGDPVVSPYTPSGNITLYAKFTQLSEDVSLKSLKYGETSITLVPGQYTYNVELPYKAVVEVPVVTAEKNDAKATMSAITQATAVPGQATFTVTAENTAIFANYVINFTKGPKDGVCLIKGQVTGENKVTITVGEGTGAASGIKNTSTFGEQTGYKFNSRPAYIGVALSDERQFQKGDVVNVFVTTTYAGPVNLWYGMQPTQKMAEASTNMVQGVNTIVLTEDPETDAIYLCRGAEGQANENWNPYVAYIEVMRPMNPTITGISFNGVAAVVKNDANPKTITATVPYSTDFSAITVVDTIISNDNSKVTKNYPSTWVEGDNTITLTDKDGDVTTYTVTLTKAAASSDATLKSLSVEGYTLDPAFSAETLVYSIERAYKDRDAELPAITYEVNFSAATAVKTTEGKVVTITVTAEDGTTQKAYTITFTNKAASTDATLKSLMYGDKAITLVADQYTYNVNLPYGTTDVPALTAVKNDELASDPVINDATAFVDFQATSTATVTAESGDELVYTVNFTVAEFPSVVIFDGSTMQNMATSPDASGLSWAVVGSTMTAGDKNATYAGVNYTRSLSGGNSSATKHFTITVPENKMAKIRLLIMTNSSTSTRSAWITTTADKGNKEDAIMSVSSSSYTDLGDGTTDWLEDNTTYYIHTDNTVNFFVISAELKPIAPKCEVPAITAQPESNTQFGAGNLTASVTASVTDGGTLTYQWYNDSDDSEVAGATAATLTTTTEGSYYVIITNTLADHRDNFVKSETAQLGYRTLNDATLSALGYGETAITLVDAQYTYEVELAKGTTEVPALTATTSSPYATKVITNATAFVNYQATSTVTVTAEDGITQLTYTVHFTVRHDVEQQDVTGDMTWDFTNKGAVDAQVTGENDGTYRVLANYDGVKSSFNGQYMSADLNKITTGNLQGKGIKIHTTVPGLITIEFSNTDTKTNYRVLYINGVATTAKSKTSDHVTYSQIMAAGDIVLTAFEETKTWNMLNFYKIEFTPATRLDRSDLTAGKITGVCLENNVTHFLGAKFYYLSYKAQDESSITLAEVDHLNAGYPYIMIAEGKDVYYMPGEETATEAQNYNGLYGTFENKELGDGYCILINNKYYRTHTGNNNGCYAHRAYLKLDEVSTDPVTTAPGESAPQVSPRFFVLGGEGRGTATDLDMVGETELGEPQKFIIHNQVVIFRNGQFYNAQGALLK